jgi:hypothetical protein
MDTVTFRKKITNKTASHTTKIIINRQPNTVVNFLHKNKVIPTTHYTKYAESQKFDQTLQSTLNIPIADNLNQRIILAQQLSVHKNQQQFQHKFSQQYSQKKWRNPLLSAGVILVLLAFGLNFMLPKTMNNAILAQEVIQHIYDDTHALDVQMNIPKTNIDTLLASYGGKLRGPIGQVSFLGHCIIGGHTGIHLVLRHATGFVTVLLLPSQTINQPIMINQPQFSGVLYSSQKGSISIVSEQADIINSTRRQINQNLQWVI